MPYEKLIPKKAIMGITADGCYEWFYCPPGNRNSEEDNLCVYFSILSLIYVLLKLRASLSLSTSDVNIVISYQKLYEQFNAQ